jgi:serine/threonine-protein kinase HipA
MNHTLRTLRLYLHLPDRRRRAIGHLSQYGDILRVTFDSAYIEDTERPTLSLAFRGASEADTRAILSSTRDERVVRSDGHWPAWFANLLPEGHNRERLARARGCAEDDELELLAAAGHDLAGAVEVEAATTPDLAPDLVRAWDATMGVALPRADAVASPLEDAASLSGVVTKFSAIKEGRRYVLKRKGRPGAYILKLPSTRHPDLVENELTGYRLAEALGLHCAEATIISRRAADLPERVTFPHVLCMKRFDRGPGNSRIHMEEMAQAISYPPRQKYGKSLAVDFPIMLRLLDRLSVDPVRDVREAVRRLVVFVLMGNTDAHLKNWALLYRDGRNPELSPLYDPVCVAAWFDDLPPHEYAVNRAIDRALCSLDVPGLRSLLAAAGLARTPRLIQLAQQTVRDAQRAWPAILRDAPANVRKAITLRLKGAVALARDASRGA